MRRLIPTVVPMLVMLAACTVPSPQASPGASTSVTNTSSATAEPSQSPSNVPGGTGTGEPTAAADEPGRWAYRCSSLDASPEVQLSSLAEVWAATNYTRMDSCEVTFTGEEPYEPTPREAEAIGIADPQGTDSGLDVIANVLRLCTRVSDETGPDGFQDAGREELQAAASYCPDAPQGKIIAAWADGTRVGDGSHVAGEAVEPGTYQLVKQGPSAAECTWSVAGSGGSEAARGGLSEAMNGTQIGTGQNFTSDKCGIWGKMY
ncbi:hypothetical protein AB0N65_04515 [Paenarthrobacter sp. NPDC089322]|uniref:hypothetical protein n=1 Tax=Paenarthrobacter sp. NPDC089322 TaxID=3155065 RepID=UPI00343BEF0B